MCFQYRLHTSAVGACISKSCVIYIYLSIAEFGWELLLGAFAAVVDFGMQWVVKSSAVLENVLAELQWDLRYQWLIQQQ